MVENKNKISVRFSLKKHSVRQVWRKDSSLDLSGNYIDGCILDWCLDWFLSQHTVTDSSW